jgi:hypothetical protein
MARACATSKTPVWLLMRLIPDYTGQRPWELQRNVESLCSLDFSTLEESAATPRRHLSRTTSKASPVCHMERS